MAFVGGGLRLALATVHIGLMEIRDRLSIGAVYQPIDLLHEALVRWFGVENPRIAVLGLNPHAGEGGALGREDIEIVAPAIAELRRDRIDARGPLAADTMFHAAARRGYDAAVCMYHDQALIPVKTLDFDAAVNVTLGLPFIRTSPDHGTAFDIAGTGSARPDSLIAALKMAAAMAELRPGRTCADGSYDSLAILRGSATSAHLRIAAPRAPTALGARRLVRVQGRSDAGAPSCGWP